MSKLTATELSDDDVRDLAELRAMVQVGIDDADAGRTLSHAEVRRALKQRKVSRPAKRTAA